MPINFNPYQSTYVDPVCRISETLRTRFADNLKADDEFSQSIADMISLTPDEGAKAALEDKYRAILDERADKGDYENMGTQILRDARKFTTEYQPILENAQTRASIVENLKLRAKATSHQVCLMMLWQRWMLSTQLLVCSNQGIQRKTGS